MRTSNAQTSLFTRGYLSDALRSHAESISDRVQLISESVIRARPDAEITDELAKELTLVPLSLNRAASRMVREEIQINVRGDPRRDPFQQSGPILIPGVRVIVSVPFRGNCDLWHLRPSSFQLSGTMGSIESNSQNDSGYLHLIFQQPSDEPLENIKVALDRRFSDIEFFLNSQANDLHGYSAQLRSAIAAAVADRRARLSKHDNLSSLLGIEEARPLDRGQDITVAHPAITTPSGKTHSAQLETPQTWDVFVSHAFEDKESFARPLVTALQQRGLAVWFDETTLKVGDGLRRSIERGLAKSRFGVVIISQAFLSKEWPQRELDGLVSREEDGTKVVLPVWHGITAREVRSRSPMLADRLAVSSSMGVEKVVNELLQVIRPS
jgi:hypothetical protein